MMRKLMAVMVVLIVLGISQFSIPETQAQVSLKSMSLPGESVAVGVLYDGTYAWMLGYVTGNLYRIDFSTSPPTYTTYLDVFPDNYGAYGLTTDGQYLYGTDRSSGKIVKFDKTAGTSQIIYSGLAEPTNLIVLPNGDLLIARRGGATRITNTGSLVADIDTNINYAHIGIITFGSNALISGFSTENIGFNTFHVGGVWEVDLTTNTAIQRVSGLERPLGIAVSSNYLYVAENVRLPDTQIAPPVGNPQTPNIIKIDTTTWSIVQSVLVQGSPYGIVTYGLYVIWSSSGEDALNSKVIEVRRQRPDTLNPKNKGKWVTVYIELPASYSVSNIDTSSILLNDIVPVAPNSPQEIGDYDADSIPDLMVKFDRSEVQKILPIGEEVEIKITGEVGDISFVGFDYIKVVGK